MHTQNSITSASDFVPYTIIPIISFFLENQIPYLQRLTRTTAERSATYIPNTVSSLTTFMRPLLPSCHNLLAECSPSISRISLEVHHVTAASRSILLAAHLSAFRVRRSYSKSCCTFQFLRVPVQETRLFARIPVCQLSRAVESRKHVR